MSRLRLCTIGLAAAAAAWGSVLFQPALRAERPSPPRPAIALTRIPALQSVTPGDFNQDGIADLIGARGTLIAGRFTAQVVLAFGNGDGSFSEAQVIATGFQNPAVGDVNGDRRLDVIVTGAVIPGRGDGTFDPPVPSGVTTSVRDNHLADINGDGHLDLATVEDQTSSDRLLVFGGRGDFSFDPPVVVGVNRFRGSLTIADFNGDTRPDIAIVGLSTPSVTLFANQGGYEFGASTIGFELQPTALTSWDWNGDGVRDLIVATGVRDTVTGIQRGRLFVLLGNGDGTFHELTSVPTSLVSETAAVGDFNGDGILDLATGNSPLLVECGPDHLSALWDSVSIVAGLGDGGLDTPASFSLGDSDPVPGLTLFSSGQHRLSASDLNADGRTDLIASPGAILLGIPPQPNRAPSASAGPDQSFTAPGSVEFPEDATFMGDASDPDHDLLSFQWIDQAGRTIAITHRACVTGYTGVQTFRFVVQDGRGGEASDSVTHVFAQTDALPPGWSGNDIGTGGLPGFIAADASFDGFRFTIRGGGVDVWGTVDGFHFASAPAQGDFEVTARVTSVDPVHPWTKAGVMIRDGLGSSHRHAFLFATPTAVNGVAFQRREIAGGSTEHMAGPATGPPVWLMLRREGDLITAFSRASDSEPWASIGTQALSGLPDVVRVGLAVTSHAGQMQATASFDGVTVTALSAARSHGLPPGWSSADTGSPSLVASSAAWTGTGFTVQGSGADTWGTQDAFQFVYSELSGDATVITRVTDLEGPHVWSKAGLMIRTSLEPGAAHHFLLASEARGLAYQRRLENDQPTLHTALNPLPLPVWFAIQRQATTIHLWYSADGQAWTWIASSAFPGGRAFVGLAVTSHDATATATATFDQVVVTPGETTVEHQDIGATGIAGDATFDGVGHTISGSGADVWGNADAFHYRFWALPGDGGIVASVSTFLFPQSPHPWTKAGVMIRASTDPSSSHAFLLASRDHGLAFQRRTAHQGLTSHTDAGPLTSSPMLMLVRSGTTIAASVSGDGGRTWTDIGQDTFPEMTGTVLVGLAVTSHDNSALATAHFSDVLIER
jgi:hypothetical protein